MYYSAAHDFISFIKNSALARRYSFSFFEEPHTNSARRWSNQGKAASIMGDMLRPVNRIKGARTNSTAM